MKWSLLYRFTQKTNLSPNEFYVPDNRIMSRRIRGVQLCNNVNASFMNSTLKQQRRTSIVRECDAIVCTPQRSEHEVSRSCSGFCAEAPWRCNIVKGVPEHADLQINHHLAVMCVFCSLAVAGEKDAIIRSSRGDKAGGNCVEFNRFKG